MVLAADLSLRLGLIDAAGAAAWRRWSCAPACRCAFRRSPAAELLALMRHDKKAEGGAPRFVLLDTLGRGRIAPVDEVLVRDVLLDHGALR